MYPLTLLLYDRQVTLADKLIRRLGGVTYTHVALQIGDTIAHVAVGERPKWTTRSVYDKVLGNPAKELCLGTYQGNLTNLFAHVAAACPHRASIVKTLWHHFVVGGMHPGCTQLVCSCLRFMGHPVPDIPNPDTLLEYLTCLYLDYWPS